MATPAQDIVNRLLALLEQFGELANIAYACIRLADIVEPDWHGA